MASKEGHKFGNFDPVYDIKPFCDQWNAQLLSLLTVLAHNLIKEN